MLTIIEGSLDAIVVVNERGLIEVFNSQAQELFQYSEEEALNQNVAILLRPEKAEMHKLRLHTYLIKGAGQCGHIGKRAEKMFRKKDGTLFIAEVSMAGGRNGHLRLVVLSIQDITKRKQEEEELHLINKKLDELNSTKDKLFSIIAHDLRNPTNAIVGLSNLLLKNSSKYEPEKSKRILEVINSTSKSTLSLLENLLAWAKSQTGQITFDPINMNLIQEVNSIMELLDNSAKEKEITIFYNIDPDVKIVADRNMLHVILRNLISNAIKFTNIDGQITISYQMSNEMHEISVSDNGVGIDQTTLKKLFRVETNTSTIGTANEIGTGLGLIICKEFVERHGGKIFVESEIGSGSEFKFIIPNRPVGNKGCS